MYNALNHFGPLHYIEVTTILNIHVHCWILLIVPSQWIILLKTAVQYFDFNLKSGKTFLKEDCGKKCTCNNANLVCEDYSCPDPTICADNKCRCPKGFTTNPETGTCDGESPDLLTFNKSISSQIYSWVLFVRNALHVLGTFSPSLYEKLTFFVWEGPFTDTA